MKQTRTMKKSSSSRKSSSSSSRKSATPAKRTIATPAKRKVVTPAKRKRPTQDFKSTLKGLGMYERHPEPPKARIISDVMHDPHFKDDDSKIRLIHFKVNVYPSIDCLLSVRKPISPGDVNARLLVIEHVTGLNVSSTMSEIQAGYDKNLLEIEFDFLTQKLNVLDFLGSVLSLAVAVKYGNIKLG